ncbi:MAG: hypothetical protein CVU16_06090 [Betaproteobacteria bacterium HGW-Betaproteobacteria-10]|jgi:hypothetical protein|nr:MAG: hypothetical protein CVU16_06090 [Betaproteobacteria bacterium HGW-Betaproteobacteria-10]
MKKFFSEYISSRFPGAVFFCATWVVTSRRVELALFASVVLHLLFLIQYNAFPQSGQIDTPGILHVSLVTTKATSPASGEAQDIFVPAPHLSATVSDVFPLNALNNGVAKAPARDAMGHKSLPPEPAHVPADGVVEKNAGEARAPRSELAVGTFQAGPNGPARQVDIEFEITSGKARQLLGKGYHHYVSADGDYFGLTVSPMLEAGESTPNSAWQLNISGRINRNGLSPQIFEMKGALPERLMALRTLPEVVVSSTETMRSGRMPDGILDRQTLLYQFMHKPPESSGGKLWLTDGATYVLYTYRVEAWELLHIASIGEVRTMKLVLSTTESSEIFELWLIPHLGYLPAKVRHIDERGVETEQLVVGLSFK